ncbi:hypothetical protein LOTGIDRAFT_212782 [Lottia gigantea]|uniref:Tubulin-specific chaperone A n=1 Tax=Lottia gigantea TaxID=225164 RepID=V4AB67_LOTGI|nr:hypothetical protein LOTGIDRAFT_212782 [Lottia gigantea]ESP01244.1 hypothetical protein LOTGIDRAFT_212782 [Lottia gigantea]
MADGRIRQIKIKTGVVKRIAKEKTMYEKEAKQIEEKIEKMKTDGKDEHDVKKQMEVLQESKAMVPDALKRLRNAIDDLTNVLDNEKDLEESEEYKTAQTALTDAKAVMA